jgi:hypothetical protein
MEEIIKNMKTSNMFTYIEHLIKEMIEVTDGLEIWRISHIPQKDGELDMMLISCNILLVLK